jgi:hypothetical protein
MTILTLTNLYCIIKQKYKDVSSETKINDERIISTNMIFKEVNVEIMITLVLCIDIVYVFEIRKFDQNLTKVNLYVLLPLVIWIIIKSLIVSFTQPIAI